MKRNIRYILWIALSISCATGWSGVLYNSAENAPDDAVVQDGESWQRLDLPKGVLERGSVARKEFFCPMLPEFERAEVRIEAILPEESCVTGLVLTVKTFPGINNGLDRGKKVRFRSLPITPDGGRKTIVVPVDLRSISAEGTEAFPSCIEGFSLMRSEANRESEALIGNWSLEHKGISLSLSVGNGALLVGDLRDSAKNDPHFTVCNYGEECDVALSWHVWRQQGGTVGRDACVMRIASGESRRVELPRPVRSEVFYIEYTLEKKGIDGFRHSRQRSYAAWIPSGRYTGKMFTDEFLFANTVHLDSYPIEDVVIMLDYMQEAGYNCTRSPGGYWGDVEPSPGAWRTKRTDAITDMCLRRNLERITALHSPCRRDQDPSVVQTIAAGKPKFPYPYLDRYEKFCERRVRELKGKVRMFEDYNEVNLTACPQDMFAPYERAAYRGLKKGNSDAMLLSGCWGGLSRWDIESYYANDNPDCFDVAAFHYHGRLEQCIGIVDRICKIMAGLDKRKRWLANECATSSQRDDLYPSKTLFQKLFYSWSRGSIGYTWYNLRNKGHPERLPYDGEAAYGQLTADLCPRGTLLAQNAINGTMRDARFKEEVKSRPDVFIWRFETRAEALFPAWTMGRDASERPMLFRTDAERADIVDLFGNVSTCPIRDGILCMTVDDKGSILRLSPATASLKYDGDLVEPERKIILNGGDFGIFRWQVNNPSENDWMVKWRFELPQGARALGRAGSLRIPARGAAAIESEITVDDGFNPGGDGCTSFGVSIEGDVSGRMTSVLQPAKVVTKKSAAVFRADTRDLYTSFVEGLPEGHSMYWGGGRDLSVIAFVCYPESQALHLRFSVNDDIHVASGEGGLMYNGDSLQILLQLPGQAGSWEIGVRAQSDEKTTDFHVWRAPGGLDGAQLVKSASCRMSVSKNIPIPHLWYDVSFPYEALGTTRDVLMGGQLRFNVIVNDNDGSRREGYISLIHGNPWKVENYPVVVFGEESSAGFHSSVEAALEDAHTNLVGRLLGPEGLLLDYSGEIPTPEDCAEGRPNVMGWWSPIENGPMFTGPYLRAMCEKASRSGKESDRSLCRRMADGLIRAASVSDVLGMVVRGFGTDGKCHYPLGSEDQTIPWFYGLHAYVRSGIPDADERRRVVAKMVEVARALEKNQWKCPCDGDFTGQNRGDIAGTKLPFRNASHFLYLLCLLDEIDPSSGWHEKYLSAREEKAPGSILPRWRVCEEGYVLDMTSFPVEDAGLWIYVCAQGCLAELVRMEKDPFMKARYRRGLLRNAEHAALSLPKRLGYDNLVVDMPFDYGKWRTGYKWEKQVSQDVAERVASSGDVNVLGSRKPYERSQMTKPLSFAMVMGLSGEERYREAISRVICHFDYRTLNISEFFMSECAWYGLPRLEVK